MCGSYVSGTGRRQRLLLPDMIKNYIEKGNPARFMDAFVDSLDLSAMGFKFSLLKDGAGRPPFDPHNMLKLYLWRYFNGIRSSRKLAKMHKNQLAFTSPLVECNLRFSRITLTDCFHDIALWHFPERVDGLVSMLVYRILSKLQQFMYTIHYLILSFQDGK
jgi:hypothetical protein